MAASSRTRENLDPSVPTCGIQVNSCKDWPLVETKSSTEMIGPHRGFVRAKYSGLESCSSSSSDLRAGAVTEEALRQVSFRTLDTVSGLVSWRTVGCAKAHSVGSSKATASAAQDDFPELTFVHEWISDRKSNDATQIIVDFMRCQCRRHRYVN